MKTALNRLRAKKIALGQDGILGKVLIITLEYLANNLRVIFDQYLPSGQFPKRLEKLCLLRKENEMGKILEKIVSARLSHHLEELSPGLSEDQFGFRAGRSTIDALKALNTRSLTATVERDELLAVTVRRHGRRLLSWQVSHLGSCRLKYLLECTYSAQVGGRGVNDHQRRMSCGSGEEQMKP